MGHCISDTTNNDERNATVKLVSLDKKIKVIDANSACNRFSTKKREMSQNFSPRR